MSRHHDICEVGVNIVFSSDSRSARAPLEGPLCGGPHICRGLLNNGKERSKSSKEREAQGLKAGSKRGIRRERTSSWRDGEEWRKKEPAQVANHMIGRLQVRP